jgi:hypothetical protein
VTFYAGVAQRCVLVPAEGEDGLIHVFGIEDTQLHQEMKVLHRQAGYGTEEISSPFALWNSL